jgi:hypothetical protein
MPSYLLMFSDGDQLELEADTFEHTATHVTFSKDGEEIGAFYATSLRGFVDVDSLPEEEDEEDEDGISR